MTTRINTSRIDVKSIRPVSPDSREGVLIVIDGKPYCRMATVFEAREAIEMWARNWPAVTGKRMEVIA